MRRLIADCCPLTKKTSIPSRTKWNCRLTWGVHIEICPRYWIWRIVICNIQWNSCTCRWKWNWESNVCWICSSPLNNKPGWEFHISWIRFWGDIASTANRLPATGLANRSLISDRHPSMFKGRIIKMDIDLKWWQGNVMSCYFIYSKWWPMCSGTPVFCNRNAINSIWKWNWKIDCCIGRSKPPLYYKPTRQSGITILAKKSWVWPTNRYPSVGTGLANWWSVVRPIGCAHYTA